MMYKILGCLFLALCVYAAICGWSIRVGHVTVTGYGWVKGSYPVDPVK
jgi:hypothetical protein